MIVNITDPTDERIALYRNFRERDLVKNKRQFIAEGKTVIQALQSQSRYKLSSILVSENRVGSISNIISNAPDETPVYIVTKQTMSDIAGFDMHRGVLGLAQAPTDIKQPPKDLAGWKRVAVLAGISNHDNVGSIFRNCAAFGVDAVLLDSQTCDPLYRKAIRVSVGGVFKVPYFEFGSTDDILTLLNNHGFNTIALSPNGSTSLSKWRPVDKTALVLGTEGEGLSQALLAKMQSMRVEMDGDFDSLNVATTSGIVLHHLAINQS